MQNCGLPAKRSAASNTSEIPSLRRTSSHTLESMGSPHARRLTVRAEQRQTADGVSADDHTAQELLDKLQQRVDAVLRQDGLASLLHQAALPQDARHHHRRGVDLTGVAGEDHLVEEAMVDRKNTTIAYNERGRWELRSEHRIASSVRYSRRIDSFPRFFTMHVRTTSSTPEVSSRFSTLFTQPMMNPPTDAHSPACRSCPRRSTRHAPPRSPPVPSAGCSTAPAPPHPAVPSPPAVRPLRGSTEATSGRDRR